MIIGSLTSYLVQHWRRGYSLFAHFTRVLSGLPVFLMESLLRSPTAVLIAQRCIEVVTRPDQREVRKGLRKVPQRLTGRSYLL